MKQFFIAGVILLMAASCSKENVDMVNNVQVEETMVPVTVRVDGFSVAQSDFNGGQTRSTTIADYNNVKAVTLAFYKGDGTESYKVTQIKDDGTYTTFGEFSLNLAMGSYTMVVIARGYTEGDVLSLTSPTAAVYTTDHTRDTFVKTQTVNITNCNPVDLSATLDRIVAKLDVISSDGRVQEATNVRVTFAAGGKAFNPTTGLATVNTGFDNTVTISASAGNTSTSSSYVFLASDTQSMNVTIETLDVNGNTLFSKVVENVPFKRNRKTILTGAMYTNASLTGAFSVNKDWDETENTMNF